MKIAIIGGGRQRATNIVPFVVSFLFTTVLFTTFLGAQDAHLAGQTADFAIGEVIPRVVTRHDAGQQYSLYLPSGYDPAKSWPALFVLDPRGNAERALRLFVSGAEANGWIVLSSYQSRSDTAVSITTEAFQALLEDGERFAIDPRRLYLAGMSGTTFAAWRFAVALSDNVAGVIACGGGLPRELASPGDRVSFAYFGLAGTADFNYLDQRRLEDQLSELDGAAHRFEVFDGRHGWPPDGRWTRAAVDWLELMAVRRGLAKRGATWVDEQLAAARELAGRAAEPLTALRRHDQLVRDFDGLREVAEERRRVAELERSPRVSEARAREEKLFEQERSYYVNRFRKWVDRFDDPRRRLPRHARSLVELRVRQLSEQAADHSDPAAAQAAQRQLETAYVQVAHALPDLYENEGDLERAAAVLDVAAAIFPDRTRTLWRRAEVYASGKNRDRAFEALRAAVARGRVDVERLKTDAAWDDLRVDPRWQDLLDSLVLDDGPGEPKP